jgi:PadR family transcriptional regulator PadR
MNAASEPERADRWEIQVRKGVLELAVLASLWSGSRYGLEIIRTLEADADLAVPEGTLYPLLNRLRADGLLEAEWIESESGHPRKYYVLTAAGRKRAWEMTRFWHELTSSLASLLAPVRKEQRK